MNRRVLRLGSLIRRELGTFILSELSDPRLKGLPSITRVTVAPDLSYADVYVTIMGSETQQTLALNALKHAAGKMRLHLGQVIEIRHVPLLRIHLDEELKKEMHVLSLLNRLDRERETNAPQHELETDEKSPEQKEHGETQGPGQEPGQG